MNLYHAENVVVTSCRVRPTTSRVTTLSNLSRPCGRPMSIPGATQTSNGAIVRTDTAGRPWTTTSRAAPTSSTTDLHHRPFSAVPASRSASASTSVRRCSIGSRRCRKPHRCTACTPRTLQWRYASATAPRSRLMASSGAVGILVRTLAATRAPNVCLNDVTFYNCI